jgi:hypothetical protein
VDVTAGKQPTSCGPWLDKEIGPNESILEGHSPEPAHLDETAGVSGRGIAYVGVGYWRKHGVI